MGSENLKLWGSVEKTNPAFTKPANDGRRSFTNIDAYSQVKEATRQWGPYGHKWGLRDINYDFSLLELGGLAILKARFFYPIDGSESSFEINNSAQIKFKSGGFDKDFTKKMETNTVTKALSKLGFNADVFLGMFEDSEYLENTSNEFAIAQADDKEAVLKQQREDFFEWLRIRIATMNQAPHIGALKALHKSARASSEQRSITVKVNPDAAYDRIDKAYRAKLEQLQNTPGEAQA